MNAKKARLLIGCAVVIGALAYLGFTGFQEGKTYYTTIEELNAMGARAYEKPLRVAGIVTTGSIERTGTELTFQLEQDDLTLPVVYAGTTPVPDTFKDGAEALCDGRYRSNGTFEAKTIQAKCASKYEAEYGTAKAEN